MHVSRWKEFRDSVSQQLHAEGLKFDPLIPAPKSGFIVTQARTILNNIKKARTVVAQGSASLASLRKLGNGDAFLAERIQVDTNASALVAACAESIDALKVLVDQATGEGSSSKSSQKKKKNKHAKHQHNNNEDEDEDEEDLDEEEAHVLQEKTRRLAPQRAHLQTIVLSLYDELADASAALDAFRISSRKDPLLQTLTNSRLFGSAPKTPSVIPPTRPALPPSASSSAGSVSPVDEMQLVLAEDRQRMVESALSLHADVAHVEAQVLDIASMGSFLSSKVAEQHELIARIHEDALEAEAHAERAVGQLQKASQNRSCFRIFVLLYMLMAALMLLFLDLYM